jgi:hypothetical protein
MGVHSRSERRRGDCMGTRKEYTYGPATEDAIDSTAKTFNAMIGCTKGTSGDGMGRECRGCYHTTCMHR